MEAVIIIAVIAFIGYSVVSKMSAEAKKPPVNAPLPRDGQRQPMQGMPQSFPQTSFEPYVRNNPVPAAVAGPSPSKVKAAPEQAVPHQPAAPKAPKQAPAPIQSAKVVDHDDAYALNRKRGGGIGAADMRRAIVIKEVLDPPRSKKKAIR